MLSNILVIISLNFRELTNKTTTHQTSNRIQTEFLCLTTRDTTHKPHKTKPAEGRDPFNLRILVWRAILRPILHMFTQCPSVGLGSASQHTRSSALRGGTSVLFIFRALNTYPQGMDVGSEGLRSSKNGHTTNKARLPIIARPNNAE